MINNVVLVGRLVKDIDLRYTQSGTPVGSFTLAVNRAFKNQDGTREADFINCVVWRKAAEILANYTRKGSQVAVTGRLQTRSYENQQGERRYITEIVIENFQLLDNKGNQENQQQGNQYNQQPNNQAEPTDSQGDPFAGMGSSSIDISDDDLPF